MEQRELEQIIEAVTRQVLSAVSGGGADPALEGRRKLLVLAKPGTPVPPELLEDAVSFSLEDYETNRNILRYDQVIIGDLSITQLADIAQGRIGDSVTCAVIYALLSGIDVTLLETAPEYRKFAGKANAALYGLMESYLRTLQIFGIKVRGEKPRPVVREARPPKYAAPPVQVPRGTAAPNASRLITETEALALIRQGSPVHLPAGAIVTPSARDAFAQAKAEVVQE